MAEESETRTGGLDAAERRALKERAAETRAERRGAKRTENLQNVLDRIGRMEGTDRELAEHVHHLVTTRTRLAPRTWYGMPAYANEDGKVVAFYQDAAKFGTRYATLGFNDTARLDDGPMWPVTYALTEWTPQVEEAVTHLLQRITSSSQE